MIIKIHKYWAFSLLKNNLIYNKAKYNSLVKKNNNKVENGINYNKLIRSYIIKLDRLYFIYKLSNHNTHNITKKLRAGII